LLFVGGARSVVDLGARRISSVPRKRKFVKRKLWKFLWKFLSQKWKIFHSIMKNVS